MDVVVLVVKNKRAHLRRIQNISFCANDDGCERRESFYEVTFFDFLERGEIFYISSSSQFDSLFIFSFNIAQTGVGVSSTVVLLSKKLRRLIRQYHHHGEVITLSFRRPWKSMGKTRRRSRQKRFVVGVFAADRRKRKR